MEENWVVPRNSIYPESSVFKIILEIYEKHVKISKIEFEISEIALEYRFHLEYSNIKISIRIFEN